MAEPEEKPYLKRSQFACPKCKGEDEQGPFFFFAEAARIRKNENGDHVAICPQCEAECAELWYCANLRKSKDLQTGPTSEAGKNKVRMNRFTTGSSYASGAIPRYLPPAKPGDFAECDDCQDLDECKQAVADAMGTSQFIACHRKSEIFARYRNAHLSGDPAALKMDAADVHARQRMVLNALFKAIFTHGVLVDSIVVNKDGVVYFSQKEGEAAVPLTELKSNPATNDMIKLAEKMGFSLTDWTLTPKSKEAKAALEGYLAGQAAVKGQSMEEFIDQHKRDVKNFQCALEKGSAAAKQDEALLEAESDERAGDA